MDAAERVSSEMTTVAGAPATSRDETPIFFEAGEDVLLGILTRPTGRRLDAAMVIAASGLRGTSMGRNRMFVRLGRQAAARGFHAIRFDYHGVGESSGNADGMSLTAPFAHDLLAAVRYAEVLGVRRHVYAGVCFGARTVIAVAPSREGTAGVALVEVPIRDTHREGRTLTRYSNSQLLRIAIKPWVLAGVFKRERRAYYAKFVKAKFRAATSKKEEREARDLSWVSDDFLDRLQRLVDGRVPVLLVYGEGTENWREFQRAQSGRLGELLRAAGPTVELVTFPGQIHGFSDLLSQQRVIDSIVDWSAGLFDPRRSGVAEEREGDA